MTGIMLSLSVLLLLLALPQKLHVTVKNADVISVAIILVIMQSYTCKACWPE